MTSSEIRQKFFDFFSSKAHTIVPSAPIVVKNDPTLLFTNAGMNQFKDFFLGNKTAPYSRVADTQKCLRVSGKHNDLEEVGVDTYHHTMFEMLGNWSFGNAANSDSDTGGYFKKEAIAWSWELLTEVYKIDKDRLYVTVFEGDQQEGLERDEESFREWKKYISEDRILNGGKKDNFWEMGDTGPCGPCTEIHVDCRSDEERAAVDGKTLVNADHPQVIEIWNNVFMQFNRLNDGTLQKLSANHVDTGMGFERLVRVLQGKQSNYDTDIFSGTIEETEKITGKKYNAAAKPDDEEWKQSVAFRVIADHIRAICFTIADGQLPSNTGAGYVIRRILRRAVRYYFTYLNYKHPLLHQLVLPLAVQFKYVFGELYDQAEFVAKVIKEEEESFLRTVDKGLAMLNDISENISGEDAFKLYDTYGFPLDLTKLIAAEKGLTVDESGFEAEMQKQKNRSRAAGEMETSDWVVVAPQALAEFVGYDVLEIRTEVIRYRKVKAKGQESYQVVLSANPFYAESGGQVGDTGKLVINGQEYQVTNTKKENDLVVVFVESFPADFKGGEIIAKVDASRRRRITRHHSATHLLHAALKQVLGAHVNQKGSLVTETQLRFDFSHFSKTEPDQLAQVEKLINRKIRANIPVVIREMPKEEALAMGATALFGEKYGDVVRVVIIDENYSVELCGGTHVGFTGDLGIFKIVSETAVAAGVRRIEAVAGCIAEAYINGQIGQLNDIRQALKNPKEPLKAIENLQRENSEIQKRLNNLEARQLVVLRNELLQKDEIVNQINFVADIVEVSSAESLKKLCVEVGSQLRDYVVMLCANINGRAFVALNIAETVNAAKNLDASKIIKEQVCTLIKGGGGGNKSLATAGGQEISQLKEAIAAVRSLLQTTE
ncbi:MAG TPA: alanine--tRNA ligase [Parasegetibacter sp.]